MGDIADQMLEGLICQGCAMEMDNDNGCPGFCLSCQKESGVNEFGEKKQKQKKIKCPKCDRMIAEVGLNQHMKAKHSRKLT